MIYRVIMEIGESLYTAIVKTWRIWVYDPDDFR